MVLAIHGDQTALAFQPSPTKASHRRCDAWEQSQGSPPPQLRCHSCATKHSQRPLTNSALHQTNPNAQTKHIKLNRVKRPWGDNRHWLLYRRHWLRHPAGSEISLSVRIPLFSRAIVMPPLTRRLYRSQSANVSTIQNEKYTVIAAVGERP